MIWESFYYKEDMLKIAAKMIKRKDQKRWSERSLFLLEKDFFVAFYFIRKLIEAKTKLSTSLVSQKICIQEFSAKGKNVTLNNNHKLDGLFDINKVKDKEVTLAFLCNQFIHSYILQFSFDEEFRVLSGVFFSSDHKRNNSLFWIEYNTLVDIFVKIGDDYPSYMRKTYNPKIRDYDVWSGAEADLEAYSGAEL